MWEKVKVMYCPQKVFLKYFTSSNLCMFRPKTQCNSTWRKQYIRYLILVE